MKKKIREICRLEYGENYTRTEPSETEIREAIANQQFEYRGFQTNRDELWKEWSQGAQDWAEICRRSQAYHSRRVAYFVVFRWKEPVILNPDGIWVKDGSHRLLAAKYLGMTEVECEIMKTA